MAFDKKLVPDMAIKGLYEAQSLYNFCNRSYDGLVQEGATSVDIPLNPQLVVTNTGNAANSGNRKKAKADTTMANVPFAKAIVSLAEEIEARFETNGKLIDGFVSDVQDAMIEEFDKAVITQAQNTTNKIPFAAATLQWGDIIKISQKFSELKVPNRDRIVVVDAGLESEFKEIDVVKQAMAFNKELLEQGIVVINGMRFFISANVNPVNTDKKNLVGIWGPGLAFVLKDQMKRKERYDEETASDLIDYISYYAAKLLKNQYAIVVHQN